LEAIFAFHYPAIVWDQTGYEGGISDVYYGHDGIKRFFREWLEPFESFYAHAEDFIDAGEAVVVRARQGGRGKQSGVDVEMPPYWQVYRLADGRAVRIEVYSDKARPFKPSGSRSKRARVTGFRAL
jgi:ketosteroid isomerase-like protein